MKKKIVSLVLVFAMALALGIGGTVAWLTAKTETVTNTFTVGDINLKLEETDSEQDTDENVNTNKYKMVPGNTITKDPIVTVLKDSENCWLFVKVVKSDNFDTFMTYEMATGWELVEGQSNVYVCQVDASTDDQLFAVIKDNTVTVKSEVTKEMLTEKSFTEPTLEITAYAIQRDNNFTTAAAAWAEVSKG